jgi:formylglycine-generating enzyme required for sulfatase activity
MPTILHEWLRRGTANRLVINDRDGSVLVYVPPGEFEMGDGQDTDCPKHRVWLDGYYIGIYAVSNAQYKRFVDATGHRAPDKADYSYGGGPVWQGNSFPSAKADHPVVCVSWDDAQAYAKWAGLSLPTEAQWEKAARGPRNWRYPWGDTWDGDRCRHSGNRGSETTCVVYGYPRGVSGYGCYNMSGNVSEWCEDWYDAGYYEKGPSRNPRGPDGGSHRVSRGGGWGNDVASSFRGAFRYGIDPGYRRVNLGFRLLRIVS